MQHRSYKNLLDHLAPLPDRPPAISVDEYLLRIAAVQDYLAQSDVDAIVVGAGDSLRYFTGMGWGA